MGRLTIGLVLDDSLDQSRTDGVQQYVRTVGGWLQQQGYEVHYLAGKTVDSDLPVHSLSGNIPVRFNQNRLSIPLPAPRQPIRQILAAKQFDVLHVQLPCSPWLAGRVVEAVLPETAIVGTFHIAPYSSTVQAANRMLGWYETKLMRRFQVVMSVSFAAQKLAQEAYHLQSVVVPNAIDLSKYRKRLSSKVDNHVVHIVFLGRLEKRKGCQYLLEAITALHQTAELPPFQVTIGGRGSLNERLHTYVVRHGLEKVVRFSGFVAETDKAAFLAAADIAVFPSTGGESFGIVLLEAMAAAKGVVLAGNNEGYASVMHPRTEQLFDPRQTDAFADTLAHFIKDSSAREKARLWQRDHVQQFDIEQVGPRIVEIYTRALRTRQDVR